jgi:outer membrane biosynthesis protein TonB
MAIEGMKSSLAMSGVAHAAVLLWGLVAFAARPLDTAPADSLPVDIISTTEFSQITAGNRNAKKAETPKPLVEKVAEPKPAEEPTAKVTEKPEIQTASAAEPPPLPQAKPEPKPEPPKEAKKPEPKTDPIAEALKKEETRKPVEKKVETPTPPKKPTPEQPKFDARKVAALLDKRDPQRNAAAGEVLNSTASLGLARANAASLSQTEIDALRAQIQACWNPPAGAAEAKELIVRVRIILNQDGSLSGEPTLVTRGGNSFFQIAAESAMRAIRRCQPYRLPIAKYEAWKDVEVTFDPRDMFRG